MSTEVNTVSTAQAKQILSDKRIDREEAKSLGLSEEQANILTEGLQGNYVNKKGLLEKWMQDGTIVDLPKEKRSSFVGRLLRKMELNKTADFLEDKDKVCTDGNDDGKLTFKDGAKSFLKGLVGGIPKAMINHPIATAVTVAAGSAAMIITGGAAAPVLWGLGAALATGTTINGVVKYAKADNDAAAKQALEMTGTGVSGIVLAEATKSSIWKAAQKAGVDTSGNFFQTIKSSLKTSKLNANDNMLYWGKGVVDRHSTVFRNAEDVPTDVKLEEYVALKKLPEGTTVRNDMFSTADPEFVKTGKNTIIAVREDGRNNFLNSDMLLKLQKNTEAVTSMIKNGTGTRVNGKLLIDNLRYGELPYPTKVTVNGTTYIASKEFSNYDMAWYYLYKPEQ